MPQLRPEGAANVGSTASRRPCRPGEAATRYRWRSSVGWSLEGTNDGCDGMSQAQVDRVPGYCGKGSRSELIDGVGHFMTVEQPEDHHRKVLELFQER